MDRSPERGEETHVNGTLIPSKTFSFILPEASLAYKEFPGYHANGEEGGGGRPKTVYLLKVLDLGQA